MQTLIKCADCGRERLGYGALCNSCISRRYREANPERTWASQIRIKYGITPNDYYQMLEEQDGTCAICGNVQQGKLCIDHNHETGNVRGLLCGNCNTALGLMQDSPSLLREAASYLESK